MRFHMLHPRDQLVAIMNRIYHNGMTTLSGGNLSIRDDDDNIWITPAGVDKGKLTPKDIICVRPDGTSIGLHRPSSELPFHRAIYARRPDLRAVVHAHAPALVSFSIVRADAEHQHHPPGAAGVRLGRLCAVRACRAARRWARASPTPSPTVTTSSCWKTTASPPAA